MKSATIKCVAISVVLVAAQGCVAYAPPPPPMPYAPYGYAPAYAPGYYPPAVGVGITPVFGFGHWGFRRR